LAANQVPSRIENLERIDGKLILQGAENGYKEVRDGTGWSIAVSEETGKIVLTESGDQVAFVVFGACVPKSELNQIWY
jgi:predicted regulator of Ras-like GTPase activity (Roadblock/LC7/MglB family)